MILFGRGFHVTCQLLSVTTLLRESFLISWWLRKKSSTIHHTIYFEYIYIFSNMNGPKLLSFKMYFLQVHSTRNQIFIWTPRNPTISLSIQNGMACNIFLVKFFPHTVCFKSPSHVINSKGFLAATLNIKGLKKTYRL